MAKLPQVNKTKYVLILLAVIAVGFFLIANISGNVSTCKQVLASGDEAELYQTVLNEQLRDVTLDVIFSLTKIRNEVQAFNVSGQAGCPVSVSLPAPVALPSGGEVNFIYSRLSDSTYKMGVSLAGLDYYAD